MTQEIVEQHKVVADIQRKLVPGLAELEEQKKKLSELCIIEFELHGKSDPVAGVSVHVSMSFEYNKEVVETIALQKWPTMVHMDHGMFKKYLREDIMTTDMRNLIGLVTSYAPKTIISRKLYEPSDLGK